MTDAFTVLSEALTLESEPIYQHGKTVMKLYRGATEGDFLNAAANLIKSGYKAVSEHNLAANRSVTLVDNDSLAQLYFTPCDGCIRAIFDKNTTLPPLTKAADGETTLWQFEVDHSLIDCGMCYIIKCADGSFFIIDSAHFYSVNDNDRIYRFLRDRTPENEKIRISAWFFSHGHIDHIAKFMDFVADSHEDVILERIIYNFCSSSHPDCCNWSESDRLKLDQFEALASSFTETQVITAHTGQRFYVANLDVEVLCTHEDVYPGSLADFNDSSVVIRILVNGNTLFFPGDAAGEESKILVARYGNELKSDILQIAHHGHFGLSVEFYELASAPVIMFPTTQIKYDEELPHFEANRKAYVISDECYIASNGTVEFSLPYEPGTAKVFPDETFENFEGVKNLWGYEYTDEKKQQLYDEYLKRGGKEI